nr:NADH dehydrogenase subunit 3 [Isocladus armatus]
MVLCASLSAVLFGLGGVLLGVASLLGKKADSDREKCSPFECGFDPEGGSRLAFSLRFFLIAIVFLVFDVEITLLLPMAIGGGGSLVVWGSLGAYFLFILLAGTYHEWREGALDWKL